MEPPIQELNLRSTVVLLAINFRRMLCTEKEPTPNVTQTVSLQVTFRDKQHKEPGVCANMLLKKVHFSTSAMLPTCPAFAIRNNHSGTGNVVFTLSLNCKWLRQGMGKVESNNTAVYSVSSNTALGLKRLMLLDLSHLVFFGPINSFCFQNVLYQ